MPGPGGGRAGRVSLECLTEALKGTAPSKAPGSDGLTYEVYKAFWDVLQQPLADCFNEAFQGLGVRDGSVIGRVCALRRRAPGPVLGGWPA